MIWSIVHVEIFIAHAPVIVFGLGYKTLEEPLSGQHSSGPYPEI